MGKIQVRWRLDTSKMKVDYSDEDVALRSGKVQVRWELDTSEIEVR